MHFLRRKLLFCTAKWKVTFHVNSFSQSRARCTFSMLCDSQDRLQLLSQVFDFESCKSSGFQKHFSDFRIRQTHFWNSIVTGDKKENLFSGGIWVDTEPQVVKVSKEIQQNFFLLNIKYFSSHAKQISSAPSPDLLVSKEKKIFFVCRVT